MVNGHINFMCCCVLFHSTTLHACLVELLVHSPTLRACLVELLISSRLHFYLKQVASFAWQQIVFIIFPNGFISTELAAFYTDCPLSGFLGMKF